MSSVNTVTGEITEGTDLVVADLASEIAALRDGKANVVHWLDTNSFDGRMALYKAVDGAQAVSETLIGKTINLKTFIIQSVSVRNRTTQEMSDQPRIVLIDDKGQAFAAVSKGIYFALRNLVQIVGTPNTWEQPIAMKVEKEKTANGDMFTIKIA